MSNHVVLRYFPVLGRAQALRHSLRDAGVEFEDVHVAVSDWPQRRDDADFSGRFRALPTLTWGAATLSEALPIAGFLARRLGQCEGISDEAVAHREAVCSSSYIDVLLRFADLLRADVTYPGADSGRAFAPLASRVLQKADFLDRAVPASGWIGGGDPVVADFFAAEAYEVLRYMLGPARDPALRATLPRLSVLAQRVRERPRLAASFESRPARFTARPDEDRVVGLLRAVDLSHLGF